MNTTELEKCVICDWEIKDNGIKMHIAGKDTKVCCDDCAALAKDREQISCHINGLFQAFIRKDLNAIRNGHTADWKGFQVGSTHLVRGIEQYMEAAEQAMRTFNGTRYEILDLDIQIQGDQSVVFYLARYWFTGTAGEQSILLRSVDLYRRELQGWNQAGSNICTVAG